jgi:hypothetical protein
MDSAIETMGTALSQAVANNDQPAIDSLTSAINAVYAAMLALSNYIAEYEGECEEEPPVLVPDQVPDQEP